MAILTKPIFQLFLYVKSYNINILTWSDPKAKALSLLFKTE